VRRAFDHFGSPLIHALARRLRSDERGTVNFRRYSQQDPARGGLLRTDAVLLAVLEELIEGDSELLAQFLHRFAMEADHRAQAEDPTNECVSALVDLDPRRLPVCFIVFMV
jgi:hypothetical protein